MGESLDNQIVKEGVEVALSIKSIARTRRTQVAIAYETPHGWIPQATGVNTEPDTFLGGLHGEQFGIVRSYPNGLRTTDYRRMIEVYSDPTERVVAAYPACPDCWSVQYPLTHGGLQIVVARVDGRTVDSWALKGDIFHLKPPGVLYPSEDLMKQNPLSNFTPLGNRSLLDPTGWMRHRNDMEAVLEVAFRHRDSVVGLIPRAKQIVCDSVAIGMSDGKVFAGFPIQTKLYKGYNPEMVATVQPLGESYNGVNFRVLGAIVPDWVPHEHTVGFLGMALDYQHTLLEWGNRDPTAWRVTASDHSGNRTYDGTLAHILRQPEKIGAFGKFFESQRVRQACEPKEARSRY